MRFVLVSSVKFGFLGLGDGSGSKVLLKEMEYPDLEVSEVFFMSLLGFTSYLFFISLQISILWLYFFIGLRN